jgi:hypothetical protein
MIRKTGFGSLVARMEKTLPSAEQNTGAHLQARSDLTNWFGFALAF